jgi:predicted nucleic acid-binding protein
LLKGLSIVVIQSWEKTRLKVVLSVILKSELSVTVKIDKLRARFRVRSCDYLMVNIVTKLKLNYRATTLL